MNWKGTRLITDMKERSGCELMNSQVCGEAENTPEDWQVDGGFRASPIEKMAPVLLGVVMMAFVIGIAFLVASCTNICAVREGVSLIEQGNVIWLGRFGVAFVVLSVWSFMLLRVWRWESLQEDLGEDAV